MEVQGVPDILETQDYLGIGYYLLQQKYLLYPLFKDLKVVLTMHAPSFLYLDVNQVPYYKFPDYWIGEMEKASIRKADKVISPSNFLIEALMPLMHIETRPDAWRAGFAAHGVDAPSARGTIYDQFATITQAALHGLGVALLPDYLAEQDLATGRLVCAWGGAAQTPGAYYLVWPLRNARDPALLKFRDWLAGQAEDEDPLPR
jgi:hypothetical protein